MSDCILTVNQIVKYYNKLCAVDHVSFVIKRGQIFGLLGPNGSGKTTTLGMILSLLKPTSGEINIFGSSDLDLARKKIGATLEITGFYTEFSGEKNLHITGKIKNSSAGQIREALHNVGLWDRRKDPVKKYSFGMKQRLTIAGALLNDPDLLILDEPTNGLDPLGIVEVRSLILSHASIGKTVLVASHLLDEMQKICTHIAILNKGKILTCGAIQDVIGDAPSLEHKFIALTQQNEIQYPVGN